MIFKVFSEGTALGNQAMVIPCSDLNQLPNTEKNSTQPLVTAFCYIQEKSFRTDSSVSVRWIGKQGDIQFCGHGALALACFLDNQDLLSQAQTLCFPAGQYFLKKAAGYYWFCGLSDYEFSPCKLPQLEQIAATNKIVEVFECMGDSGYIIMRFGDDIDLRTISPNLTRLKATTKQALIITSAISNNPDFDYSLRYFAPQHGDSEDPATGSANEIAAKFWHPRLKKNKMRCFQASDRGGVINLHAENGRIWIGGKVSLI